MNKDYVFHIKWEDRHKITYRVGILAQIDEFFYLILKGPKNSEMACKNGFIGIPGFKVEEVYKSGELFDFFKSRILETSRENQCEELAKNKGISMIDSFSLEEALEEIVPKYKEIILEAYELQERKNEIQREEGKKKSELGALEDIE